MTWRTEEERTALVDELRRLTFDELVEHCSAVLERHRRTRP